MDSLMNTMLQQLAGTVGGARPEQLAQVARLMKEQKQICITGAGRTGLVMRMLAMRLAVMHNLYFYNKLAQRIRDALDAGQFAAFRAEYSEKLAGRI